MLYLFSQPTARYRFPFVKLNEISMSVIAMIDFTSGPDIRYHIIYIPDVYRSSIDHHSIVSYNLSNLGYSLT